MGYVTEHYPNTYVIGISIRTSNQECHQTMPPLWERFYKEKLFDKISHKKNQNILAVYTDYEGDHTKPYTYIIGCEVTSLDSIPKGLVGKKIPASTYAIFTTEGQYPDALRHCWKRIWASHVKRAYTTDFELYQPDFNPITHPEVKIYIATKN